jgi:hypothetical protein
MLVTFVGIVMVRIPVQPKNALLPIVVKIYGITKVVVARDPSAVHPSNALFPIDTVDEGSTKSYVDPSTTQPLNALSPTVCNTVPCANETYCNNGQPENAPFGIDVIDRGSITDNSFDKPLKFKDFTLHSSNTLSPSKLVSSPPAKNEAVASNVQL